MNHSINKLFELSGKIAFVTGAARGNGFAIANGLHSAGAKVYFVDKQEEELIKNVMSLKSVNAIPAVCDITLESDVDSLIKQVISQSNQIDILVNNAGISLGGNSSESYDYSDWESTFDVNINALFKLTQKISKNMIQQKQGVIINITSLGSELGFPDNPAYVASKGALKMLGKALAFDLAKYNIRVNNIVPGYIHTQMTDKSYNNKELYHNRLDKMLIRRWGKPDDLIGASIFLASDASSYITGIDLPVDGGWLAKGI